MTPKSKARSKRERAEGVRSVCRSLPGDHHLEKPHTAGESEHKGAPAEESKGGQTSKNQVATHLREERPHRVIPKVGNWPAEGGRPDVELVPSQQPIVVKVVRMDHHEE